MAFCPFFVHLECPEDCSCALYSNGCPFAKFGGNVYSKTMTMEDDNATRFESTAKKLRDVVIIVETNAMLLGESGTEVYPVEAEDTLGFTKMDASTLYFKNAEAGKNGKITILAVEE